MATTTWSYGVAGDALQFEVVYDADTGLITVTMLAGSMDLNALYVSDGDNTVEGSLTKLTKSDSSLNMNGTGETWDDNVLLNSAGLKASDAQYFISAGSANDSYTLTQAQMDALFGGTLSISEDGDLSGLTIGVRATSVNGSGSIKGVLDEAVYDDGSGDDGGDDTGPLFLSVDATGVWSDTDKDGVRDTGESNYDTASLETDLDTREVTVAFWQFDVDTIDLSGFNADDKVIVDFTKWDDALGKVAGDQNIVGRLLPPETSSSSSSSGGFYPSGSGTIGALQLRTGTATPTFVAIFEAAWSAPETNGFGYVTLGGVGFMGMFSSNASVTPAQVQITWPDPVVYG